MSSRSGAGTLNVTLIVPPPISRFTDMISSGASGSLAHVPYALVEIIFCDIKVGDYSRSLERIEDPEGAILFICDAELLQNQIGKNLLSEPVGIVAPGVWRVKAKNEAEVFLADPAY